MLLIDENLSPRLPELLEEFYPGCVHVENIHLESADDTHIWVFAKGKNYAILTKDSDFNQLLKVKGFPPKIIWLRIGNASTQQIMESIKSIREEIWSFLKKPDAGLLEIF
jgi:predicted nuclease of predicted toxin-antitoxin system